MLMSRFKLFWLASITIACAGIWIAAIISAKELSLFSVFLAGGSFAIFVLFTLVMGIARIFGNLDDDSKYIKVKYPEVWKKLHPWGDYSYNNFNSIAFVKGQYDDGSDSKLNEIKKRYIAKIIPLVWTFGLTLVSFIVTFVLASKK